MFKSIAALSIKVFLATILFWLTTLLIFSMFAGFITGYTHSGGKALAQQLSATIKGELTQCSIAPIMTMESYKESRHQEKAKDREENSIGLLNFDSDDIENAIEVYLEMTTFKVDCG